MAPPFSAVERLQSLSLVSKICTEMDNELGLSDKTLAEFIIDLAENTDGTWRKALRGKP